MDSLDHLAGPAADLLGRVDDLLATTGAPDQHRIWPLLRRLRALPGEAAAAVIALRPEPLAAAGARLRGLIHGYDETGATMAAEVTWEGAGADASAARRAALAAHLTGGPESLVGRLDATASYLDAVLDWMVTGRTALARTLVEVLSSAEAVAIVAASATSPTASTGAAFTGTGWPVPVASVASSAAAEVGARVLATVAEIHERGEVVRHGFSPIVAEVSVRLPAETATRLDVITRIEF